MINSRVFTEEDGRMEKVLELHQIIYGLFAAQIEFGTYGYKDPLPKMEDVITGFLFLWIQ